MSRVIKPFETPRVSSRRQLQLSQGGDLRSVTLPATGEVPSFEQQEEFLSSVLTALGRTYAPRRMVKIAHPDDPVGIKVAAGATMAFQLPPQFRNAVCIPFLTYRIARHEFDDSADVTWVKAQIGPGGADTPANHFVDLRIILVPEAQVDVALISHTFSDDIHVRGALYFPEVAFDTAGPRVLVVT